MLGYSFCTQYLLHNFVIYLKKYRVGILKLLISIQLFINHLTSSKSLHLFEIYILLYFSVILIWRQWHPTPVLLPGKSHGRRSLVGCSPWGREESDTTERLHFHFSLSCIGGGHGNPLQCSCLENPRDGGAWWAAVYGVTQSRTRLKRLSSNSSRIWLWIYYFWSKTSQNIKK